MAKKNVQFYQLNKVLAKMNQEFAKLGGEPTTQALLHAAILLRRDMKKTSPKVPIDTHNLEMSWFVVTNVGQAQSGGSLKTAKDQANHQRVTTGAITQVAGKSPAVITGFSANYATYVHEARKGMKYREPGAGPKFFQAALARNRKKILQLMRDGIKVD